MTFTTFSYFFTEVRVVDWDAGEPTPFVTAGADGRPGCRCPLFLLRRAGGRLAGRVVPDGGVRTSPSVFSSSAVTPTGRAELHTGVPQVTAAYFDSCGGAAGCCPPSRPSTMGRILALFGLFSSPFGPCLPPRWWLVRAARVLSAGGLLSAGLRPPLFRGVAFSASQAVYLASRCAVGGLPRRCFFAVPVWPT